MFSHVRTSRLGLIAATTTAVLALAVSGCAQAGDTSSPGASASGGGGDAASEVTPLDIVAGVAATPSSADLLLGIEKGFFEEQGLNVTTTPSATGAAGVTQLVSGQVQVALGGVSGIVTAVSQGIPIVFVSGGVVDSQSEQGDQYATLVKKDSGIESFKDLAGKKVALNSLGCCWDFWTRESVEKDGGDPGTLQMVQMPFAQQVAALEGGQVDAITTQQPFVTQGTQKGFVSLGDPAAIAYDDPANGNTNYFMSKDYVSSHPDVVERWRAALQKSVDYANEHPDEVRATIVETTKTDKALVDAAPVPLYTAELNTDTIEKEAEFLVKYGVLKEAPAIEDLVVP